MYSRLIAVALLVTMATSSAHGQSMPPGESPWSRPYLTGDWRGARTALADRGVTFDLQYTSTYQGLISSNGDAGYGGKFDAFIDLDSGKLGLWQGGELQTHIEYRHGNAKSNLGNTLFATNTAQLWPVDEPEEWVATSLYYMQKVGERSAVMLGKFNPVDLLAKDPFFGGWGIHRFMNLIFVAPPSGLVPPVFMGAVANIRSERLNWTIMVFDPSDRTTDYFPGDLFSDGVNLSITASHVAKRADRQTSYAVTANYSTAEGVDYSTLPPGIQTTDKSGAWNLAFQFTHNLREDRVHAGDNWAFNFKGAIADGNPNYVQASVIAGISGKALLLSRPQDRFGLGIFYYDISDDLQNSLDPLVEFGDEAGIEAFYNWSVTPWLSFDADIQYIDPARKGDDGNLIAAVRANVRF
jgi:porin